MKKIIRSTGVLLLLITGIYAALVLIPRKYRV